MIILHKGKKMVEGNVSTLLDPAHTLIEIATLNNEAAKQLLLQSAWAASLQGNHQLQLMMDKTMVPQLINFLVANNVQILSVNTSHSLENYFLSLTTQSGHVEAFAN
jgi:ABC-type multidrug transport system ATPase subunit